MAKIVKGHIVKQLPYLTEEIPGIGGKIKQQPEDFKVVEIPAYPASGQGEHLLLLVEKSGITTYDVLQQLARTLHLSPHTIGYAGIKDCHAITQQYFSVPISVQSYLNSLELYNARILQVQQHSNKIRIGHLRGNSFEILVRNPHETWQKNLPEIAKILQTKGIPNYYGPQRFGNQNNTHWLGRALLQNKVQEILYYLLSEDHIEDSERLKEAKQFFREKKYKEALEVIPNSFTTEKFLLRSLANHIPAEQAVDRIHKKIKAFYVSAYQSYLFNLTLAQRLYEIDKLWLGDLAMKHPGQAVFRVEDLAKEQERCDKKEISPTGPMFGYKMIQPQGKQSEIEQVLLQQENVQLEEFRAFHYKGERRSYRFFGQISWQPNPDGILLSLTLPKGCYATVVLSEIMKTQLDRPELWEDEDNEDNED